MNAKNTKKSAIHENADANITCDFGDGDGDISRSRSRLPPTHTDSHIVSSIIVRSVSAVIFAAQLHASSAYYFHQRCNGVASPGNKDNIVVI